MSNLVPQSGTDLTPTVGIGAAALAASDRRTAKALSNLGRHTIVRLASVEAHGMVQTEKVHEVDRLTREAISGQAMLGQWASTLAKGDPFMADELKFFSDLARIGKGEIIADTISDFCREGRR